MKGVKGVYLLNVELPGVNQSLSSPWKNSSCSHLERRKTEDSSSRRIMHLVPVFILEAHNQTKYKCFPSSSRRIVSLLRKPRGATDHFCFSVFFFLLFNFLGFHFTNFGLFFFTFQFFTFSFYQFCFFFFFTFQYFSFSFYQFLFLLL